MRVGILTQWYDPEPGGASIPGVLARGLAERGHDVRVLTGFPNYPTGRIYAGFQQKVRSMESSDGVTVTRVPLVPSHDSSALKRSANYGSFSLSASAFGLPQLRHLDALWVYNSPATVALPMWLLRYGARVPIVLHNMDMWPDSVFAAGFASGGSSGRVFQRMLSRWCSSMYSSASTIAYISPSAGPELQRRGVPKSKLSYIPVWINEDVFHPTTAFDLREELKISNDEVVVLYAGALGRAQGIDALVKAATLLPTDLPLRVVILGSGTEEAKIRSLAAAAPARVTFLGSVPQTEMTKYMALGDIHYVSLAPSSLSEFTMPSKIHATLACGKPILLAASGDALRVVSDSNAGFFAKPGDVASIGEQLRLAGATGRANLAKLGDVARLYYRHNFQSDRSIDQVESLLARAAAEQPRSTRYLHR